MRTLLAGLAVVLCTAVAEAQTPTGPTPRIAWSQDAVDLQEALSLRYRVYVDDVATGQLVSATCNAPSSPFTCQAAVPALTPGTHTLTLTAARVVSGSQEAESVRSAPLMIVVVVAPNAPQGLRLVP